ncbi:hypothetical protein AR679_gp134 [Yellowstone lake phycodnavirus 1]|jgi:hypothetical protein|uniref:hypothetical protein n=1 Tax=Yellowstone lake phycodnavirus 1 TaxID=1586713 RepID=UPI0006EBA98C|nr:hypothetical protein AR679_gp134 [Yellowstone lake phycodnavirus 1]BAT22160.1 hypothetical protein [Yellowstone lake phycodnavirus 1]
MLTAKELAEKDRQRQNYKKETYKVILDQFLRKVKANFDLGLKTAQVTVPPLIIGYARYDIAKATVYLHRQLVRLGYRVERLGPYDMNISWAQKVQDPETTDPEIEFPSLINLKKTAQKYSKK